MVRGFYALGSGMLTQNKALDAISNNIANIMTPGFKKGKVHKTAFGTLFINRIDSKCTPLADISLINTSDKNMTDLSQGLLKDTGRPLDFAIGGRGFFAVQNENGLFYTRNGSFNLDSEGFLTLSGKGRIMGQNGPVYLGTDDFDFDGAGNLTVGGFAADRPTVYDFDDNAKIRTSGGGLYEGDHAVLMDSPEILWKTLEESNTDAAEQMTEAITAQRSLQYDSQALKMYDQVLLKAVTEIARI